MRRHAQCCCLLVILFLCAMGLGLGHAAGNLWPPSGCALVLVDVQHCFMPGGSLPTPGGIEVVPIIVEQLLIQPYSMVVLTQDVHPRNHISFASSHPGHAVGDTLQLLYNSDGRLQNGTADLPPRNWGHRECPEAHHPDSCGGVCRFTHVQQRLWPEHCLNSSKDAAIHPLLLGALGLDPETMTPTQAAPSTKPDSLQDVLLLTKGLARSMDAYSAFFDNGHVRQTALGHRLHSQGIHAVHVAGLALDYCVLNTALDAVRLGFNTSVVVDACRATCEEGHAAALQQLQDAGVHLLLTGSRGSEEGESTGR